MRLGEEMSDDRAVTREGEGTGAVDQWGGELDRTMNIQKPPYPTDQISLEDVKQMIRKSMLKDIALLIAALSILLPLVIIGYFELIFMLPFHLAAIVTFLAIVSYIILWSRTFLPQWKRCRKSGNTFHLMGLFGGLNILFMFYLPFSIRVVPPYNEPNPTLMLVTFFIPMFLFLINALVLVGLMIHSQSISSFKAPYSFTCFLPHHLDVGVKDTNEFLDGYSERPFSFHLDVGDPRTFESFIRLLMHNLLILDYIVEDGPMMKVFFFPTSLFKRAKILFSASDSYFTVDPGNGQGTVHLSRKDYQFLKAPISYHLLCENILKRISISYEYYVKGDEKEALDVFRHSWRKVK